MNRGIYELRFMVFKSRVTSYWLYVTSNNRGGTIILLTVLILTSVLTITLISSDIVRAGIKMSRSQMNSTKAYFAAEGGAERFLWDLRKEGIDPTLICFDNKYFCFNSSNGSITDCDDTCDNGDVNMQEFEYGSYKLYYSLDGIYTNIKSYGLYSDVQRVVQVSY
jgi:hypothetical protein